MKYEINPHIFRKKLIKIMEEKGYSYVDVYNRMYPDLKVKDNVTGQSARDRARKVYNWTHGGDNPSYPKTIDDVLLLCNALDCDLDYFFTDMEEKTHDKAFICEITGLSENAVEILTNLKANVSIGDYLNYNVGNSNLITKVFCKKDHPLYSINAVLEDNSLLWSLYSYLSLPKQVKNDNIYIGDPANSILLEIAIQLRKLREINIDKQEN